MAAFSDVSSTSADPGTTPPASGRTIATPSPTPHPAAPPTVSRGASTASGTDSSPKPGFENPTLGAHWIGVNVWGLAASKDVYTCGASSVSQSQSLADTFSALKSAGVDVVRFWAFQSYAINDAGERDWTALDRVFHTAST